MSTAAQPAIAKPQPIRVFVSYSRQDDALCDEFVRALSVLQDESVEVWRDRGIAPGADWAGEIDERLKSAQIVVFLVTRDLLATEYCKMEMRVALERNQAGNARVIPVILRSCDWQSSPLGKLQALPKRGRPVVKWKDDALLNVVQGLRSVVTNLRTAGNERKGLGVAPHKIHRRWPIVVGFVALAAILLACAFLWRQYTIRLSAQSVARGNQFYSQQKWDAAKTAYTNAKDLDPQNHEAYFGLGTIYDLKKDPDNAAKMFERAANLSPLPQYRNNLADEYFKLGEYKRATEEYDKIDEFPSAALESAKINRLLNDLNIAEARNYRALRWLQDNFIANSPENQLAWYYIINDNKGITLTTHDEKLCYAQLELSITLFLRGSLSDAQKFSKLGGQTCGPDLLPDVKTELESELDRLANERPELADRSKAYILQFLTAQHP